MPTVERGSGHAHGVAAGLQACCASLVCWEPHAPCALPARPSQKKTFAILEHIQDTEHLWPTLTGPSQKNALAAGVPVGQERARIHQKPCVLCGSRGINMLPYEERCEQSVRLLTDMELMAHSDYFVGCAHARAQVCMCRAG